MRSPVEQVAHNVQLIHRQALDHLAQAHDEPVCSSVLDDAAHDLAVIQLFVVVLKMGMEQLIQDITTAGGQAAAHMGPGVFGRYQTAQLDQLQQGVLVPAGQGLLVRTLCLELRELFVGVMNQGGQLRAGLLRSIRPQNNIHFFPYDTGSRVQDVDKRLVLPVQVTHEMLCPLGQFQQRLGIDDLAGSGSLRGVVSGQQGKIFEVCADSVPYRSACRPPNFFSNFRSKYNTGRAKDGILYLSNLRKGLWILCLIPRFFLHRTGAPFAPAAAWPGGPRDRQAFAALPVC